MEEEQQPRYFQGGNWGIGSSGFDRVSNHTLTCVAGRGKAGWWWLLMGQNEKVSPSAKEGKNKNMWVAGKFGQKAVR